MTERDPSDRPGPTQHPGPADFVAAGTRMGAVEAWPSWLRVTSPDGRHVVTVIDRTASPDDPFTGEAACGCGWHRTLRSDSAAEIWRQITDHSVSPPEDL